MRILRLQANFGKLKQAVLELAPGMNILALPNEGGKTTWCAFILAMLYGVDTAERVSKDSLPVKAKYKPWDGTPMSGRMDIEWKGRLITVERSSEGRVPMGTVRIYGTESGEAVPELTADNLGKQLLGVERSVFERSAFLREQSHGITRDATLEQRLLSLVSTGEERVSYADTVSSLKAAQHDCKYNNRGALPAAEAELRALREKQTKAAEELRALAELRLQEHTLLQERTELQQRQQQELQRLEAEYRTRLATEEAEAEAAKREADSYHAEADRLPPKDQLWQWLEESERLRSQRRELGESCPEEPEQPLPPRESWGNTFPSNLQRPEHILNLWDAVDKKRRSLLPLQLLAGALFCLLVGAVLMLRHKYVPGWACFAMFAVCGLGALVLYLLESRKRRQKKAKLLLEIERTGYETPQQLRDAVAGYRVKREDYSAKLAAFEEQFALWQQQDRVLEERRATFRQVCLSAGLPDGRCETITAAIDRLALAETAAQRAESEQDNVDLLRNVLEHQLFSACLPEELQAELRTNQYELEQVRNAMEYRQGVLSAAGTPEETAAEEQQLENRIRELEQRYRALTLALSALEQANSTLRARFAPQISRDASSILSRLSGGRYDRIVLQADLHALAGSTQEAESHTDLWLSRGAGEQLYFAVRMAICNRLLPADAPLILDDAFVSFDEARLQAALRYLREDCAERQILLFTCQQREKDCLA